MNPLIEKELSKIRKAQLPKYNSETTELLILRRNNQDIEDIYSGKEYKICLEDYIINPFVGFDLHDRWNNGIKPVDKYMDVIILQLMGKMVKVSGKGDSDIIWEGWLPRKGFKVYEELR